MKEEISTFIKRHQLLFEKELVIVAVSGGPDSMALLDFLFKMSERYKIRVAATHVDHQLRGKESEEDAMYVQNYCSYRGIPIFMKQVDVLSYARRKSLGTQVAARELRYSWFKELLNEYPNSVIATGHHADDQVETVLMKMTRGSIPFHAYGIQARRKFDSGAIVRPFLCITKDKIEQYCVENAIIPRRDSSNQSLTYTRNRFRNDILPLLKKENGNLPLHIQRKVEWSFDDHQYLQMLAREAMKEVVIKKGERQVTISRVAFGNVALPLQRRLIQLILSYLYGNNKSMITSIHIEQVLELLKSGNGSKELHLAASLIVNLEYDSCHFTHQKVNKMKEQAQVLTVPGRIERLDWIVEAEVTTEAVVEGDHQIVLDLDKVRLPLIVRGRVEGDRMVCRGMTGTKKVSRLFIDKKITKQEREYWPILVDGEGNILWVPLLHRSEHSCVGTETKKRLVVSCYRQDQEKSNWLTE